MGSTQKIEDLEQKYRLMLVMRLEREALESRGVLKFSGDAAVQRRESSKALASRFPGALKELDQLSSTKLEQRLQELEQLTSNDADLPQWASVCWDYHTLLRQALAAKLWLHDQQAAVMDDLALQNAWQVADRTFYCAQDWPDAYRGARLLELISHPPGGRLSQLVWEVLRERFGMPEHELRMIVFGTDHD